MTNLWKGLRHKTRTFADKCDCISIPKDTENDKTNWEAFNEHMVRRYERDHEHTFKKKEIISEYP